MADSDYRNVLLAPGVPSREGLSNALELRGAYVISEAEDPQDLSTGLIEVLIYLGVVFWYDPLDALTAHDGTSCIVDADGKRFKSDGTAGHNSRLKVVIDKDLSTPPATPDVGDVYIVAAGGTGAWATKDKNFAEYTERGWRFIVPMAFDIAMVVDEALYYHYSAGGAWTSGLPALTIADGSISLKKLKYFPLGVSVENQTTNTPPGSPADGVAYIVGGTPTGAWVGHSLDLAIYETSGWVFYDGYEGAEVYDKSLDVTYIHNGSTWETPNVPQWELVPGGHIVVTSSSGAQSLFGLGAYKALRFTVTAFKPVNDDVTLNMRLSSDGATFISTSTYTGGTAWTLTGNVGNGVNDGASAGHGMIFDFNVAQKTKIASHFVSGDGQQTINTTQLLGWHTTLIAMQGIQFLASAGNIALLDVVVEGLL